MPMLLIAGVKMGAGGGTPVTPHVTTLPFLFAETSP